METRNLRTFSRDLLLASAFVYTLVKACVAPVFHDEAVTSLYLAHQPFLGIFEYYTPYIYNNHLLNTVLIKILTSVFPLNEIVVRIPALLGHVVYLAAARRLLKCFLPDSLQWAGAILVAFNPFMLDLFSAARGYGLGLGFLMMGLYWFLRAIEDLKADGQYLKWHMAFLFFAFAVLCNFTFVQVYAAILIFFFLVCCRTKQIVRGLMTVFPSLFILSVLCAYPMAFLSALLFDNNGDYLGGADGFWSATVQSLITDSGYRQDYAVLFAGFYKVLVPAVFFGSGFFILMKLLRKEPWEGLGKAVFALWIILCSLIIIIKLQWQFHQIKYVIGRHAVYFIPIFWMTFLSLAAAVFRGTRYGQVKKAIAGFLSALAVLMFMHFLSSMDFRQYAIAESSSSARAVVDFIRQEQDGKAFPRAPVTIGSNWRLRPMVDFYQRKYRLDWLISAEYEDAMKDRYDYVFGFLDPRYDFKAAEFHREHLKKRKALDLLIDFQETGTFLAVPEKKI